MGSMRIEVQQTLSSNPLYSGLELPGPHVQISHGTFSALAHQILRYADQHGGDLPTGSEPRGHFADWVRAKWLTAVESGHQARFEANHCPALVAAIETDYLRHVKPPETTSPTQPVCIIPPPPPPPPVCIIPPPPPPPPVCTGAVPEPASSVLLSLGLIFLWILRRSRR